MRFMFPFLATLLVLTCGCQHARRQPGVRPTGPDLGRVEATWTARTPSDAGVAGYAAALEQLNPGARAPFDATDGLTLEEGEAVALLFNPDLRVARLDARVPLLGAQQSGRWEDPQLDLDVLKIFQSVASPWVLFSALRFTVPLSGRLGAERAAAFAEADAALREAQAAEWQVVTELRDAWSRWTTAGERVALIEAYLVDLDEVLEIARAQRASEQISEPQLRVLAMEQVRWKGELVAIRADHERQALIVKRLLGLTPEAPVGLIPEFAPDMEALDPAVERDRLSRYNLEVLAAMADYEAAERALCFEIKKRNPDLSIGPAYESDQGSDRAGLVGGTTLPLWNRNRRAIAEAQGIRDAAKAAYEVRYQQIVSELAETRTRWRAAEIRNRWLQDEVAPMADRQLEDLRRIGELGDLDVLIWKDALTSALNTKSRMLETRLERALSANIARSLLEPLTTPSPR